MENQPKKKGTLSWKFVVLAIFLIYFVVIFNREETEQNKQTDQSVQPASPVSETSKDFEAQEKEFNMAEGEPSLARNFYFIFDGSGSMDEFIGGQRKIEGAKEAVRKFMEQVPRDVNLGLYVFDNYGQREVVTIGPDNHTKFLQMIDATKSGGSTPLAQAIIYSTDRLNKQKEKQLGYGDYNLIIVTDGLAKQIPKASKYAVNHNISIYSIGLGIGADHPLNDPEFVISYTAANNFDELTKALVEAVAESPVFDDTDFQ